LIDEGPKRPASAAKERVQSIDALRGLVMIVMALDHVRDFVSVDAQRFQPDNLARTTAALFFTRWITHFCAPVFFFTAGMGAFYWLRRGRTKPQLSRFLWTRGLWLVLLELTVLRLAMNFRFEGPWLLTILWALGWSMVALGFLSRLPLRALAVVSVAVIALHNLADKVDGGPIWDVLHRQALFPLGSLKVLVAYPLIPWIFVMAAGFCSAEIVRRRKATLWLGIVLTVAFIAVRWLNVYGDPQPWAIQKTAGWTLLSFLRCTKYPPSLDFLLMTLGPALLILAWFDGRRFARTNPLIVFGRVPMFYFLCHFYLAHGLAVVLKAQYGLSGVYLMWALVVIAMYPVCLWYSRVKERSRAWWLSYL